MCRMCLVEVEGMPKLTPACVTQVADGSDQHESEGAGARTGVLEFYLVNHPLDCPICDQAGECKLQDYVAQEGRKHGRSSSRSAFGRDDFGGDILTRGLQHVHAVRALHARGRRR